MRPFLIKVQWLLETEGRKAGFPYPPCIYDIYMSIYLSKYAGIDISQYMCKYMYEMPGYMEDLRKCGPVVPRICEIQASQLSLWCHCSPLWSFGRQLSWKPAPRRGDHTGEKGPNPKADPSCLKSAKDDLFPPLGGAIRRFPPQGRCCWEDALVAQACPGMPAVAGAEYAARIQIAE